MNATGVVILGCFFYVFLCIIVHNRPFLIIFLKIERWWRELHERMEKYFKEQLNWLKDRGHYNPHSERDRYI